jgi:hypothetical protein
MFCLTFGQSAGQSIQATSKYRLSVRAAVALGLEKRLADKTDPRGRFRLPLRLSQIAVGSCNHTDVYLYGLRSSDPLEFPLLQHSEECNLSIGWQLTDLVENSSEEINEGARAAQLTLTKARCDRADRL